MDAFTIVQGGFEISWRKQGLRLEYLLDHVLTIEVIMLIALLSLSAIRQPLSAIIFGLCFTAELIPVLANRFIKKILSLTPLQPYKSSSIASNRRTPGLRVGLIFH